MFYEWTWKCCPKMRGCITLITKAVMNTGNWTRYVSLADTLVGKRKTWHPVSLNRFYDIWKYWHQSDYHLWDSHGPLVHLQLSMKILCLVFPPKGVKYSVIPKARSDKQWRLKVSIWGHLGIMVQQELQMKNILLWMNHNILNCLV